MRRLTPLVVALLVSTAACGSTVPQTQAAGTARAVITQAGGDLDSDASVESPGAAAVGGARSQAGRATSVRSRTVAAGSTRAAAPNQPIKIGLMYSTSTDAALAAIGADTRVGDARVSQDALLAYINKNGGIAGHNLVAAYHNVAATDSPATISQKACEQWLNDDHVFAAMPAASVQDNNVMRTCLHNGGVPAIYPNFYTETPDGEFAQTPLWFEAESLSLEAWARVYAAGLGKMGFFRGAKVGLVFDDGPRFTKVVNQVLLPALRRAGADVIATATESIHGAEDLPGGGSQMSSAVLNFRTKGVSHVLFFEVWQGWFMFAREAQTQGWHPLYGLSSQNALQIMIETGLLETAQLVGAKAVSWNPGVDLRPQDIGEWPRVTLCKKIFTDAGIDITEGASETYHGGLAQCSALLALWDAGKLLSGALTPHSLARAMEALGPRLAPANLPTGRFDPGRHYAAESWRPASYDESCTCFHYTGPSSPISAS